MTRLLLIRHGATNAVGRVLSGRAAGQPLNEEGWAEVRALRDLLQQERIAAIYASPLERAQQTAAALASPRGLVVRIEEALTDIDFGAWTGRPIAELRQDPEFERFNTHRAAACPPGGEPVSRVEARMAGALRALAAAHPQVTVAVVSHADPLRVALAHFIGLSIDHSTRLEIETGSLTELHLGSYEPRLSFMNVKPQRHP